MKPFLLENSLGISKVSITRVKEKFDDVQIDKQADVNPHNACVQFPKILAKRMGKSVHEVRTMRMEFRRRHGLV